MSLRLPVTSLGVIAPGAVGRDAFRDLLLEGRCPIGEVDRFDTSRLSAHKAALVRDFQPRQFIAPMKLRRMNQLSRLAVSAAKMAIETGEPLDARTTGVAIGTAFGPVQTSVDYLAEYAVKGAALAPPQLFAESVANAPGSHIAIEWGFKAFNMTVTQRESSALSAAMVAAAQVAKGAAEAAVVGGVEEASEMLFSVLDRVGALAHGPDEGSRPFDARRNGLVLGEGSAMMVLRRRAAGRVLGYLSGFGIARDTSASLSDWGDDADAVVVAMRAAIGDANLDPSEIDAIYASANSSVRGDRLEYRAIQKLFGAAAPPVVAVKGAFGEYAGAGSLQLAAALMALESQVLPGTCGFAQPEEGMLLDVLTKAEQRSLRHVLVNSISAGGGIVSAVLSRDAA